jgi:hypothetical protein
MSGGVVGPESHRRWSFVRLPRDLGPWTVGIGPFRLEGWDMVARLYR